MRINCIRAEVYGVFQWSVRCSSFSINISFFGLGPQFYLVAMQETAK